MSEIRPQPGPQTAFLASDADIALYGGAAGSGKTFAALLAAMRWVGKPGYGAIVFRRTSPELTGPDSVWTQSTRIGNALGGTARESPNLDWRFPNGALVEFRHLQHEKDTTGHQGKRYACIVFEEVTHFTEDQFWFLYGRLGTTCGVKAHMRATCNPDPDSFVRRLIDWWIGEDGTPIPERAGVKRWFVRDDAGKLRWFDSESECAAFCEGLPSVEGQDRPRPASLAFFPARLSDNRMGDPDYANKLASLPLVQRKRLLGGNWNVREEGGAVFNKGMFRIVSARPQVVARSLRAWDLAATKPSETNRDPDWTRGVAIDELVDGGYYIANIASIREAPGPVEAFITATAISDGPGRTQCFWQDPGAAGKADCDAKLRACAVAGRRAISEVAGSSKTQFANVWAPIAQRGEVCVQDSGVTAEALDELEAFPGGQHDDIVDAISLAFQCWSKVPRIDEEASSTVARGAAVLGLPRHHGRSSW